ncbi:DinB family protein [Ginsengibacter hankyongi]|nr:DinB family protein [Ginsengibacter hankyongi]
MTTDTINTTELFLSLDKTWTELVQMISSTSDEVINAVPFEGSWTAAQLVTHVTKSNNAIIQGLDMEGKLAERNPEDGVPNLKKIFLDFDTKFQSPQFIVPENRNYDKHEVITVLRGSIDRLKDARKKTNLIEIINLPVFGEITKLELLHFVLYHTQRHNHQLEGIINALKRNRH